MVDIRMLDWNELVALKDQVSIEMKVREQERFQKLAQNAADALNALKEAYPHVLLEISGTDLEDNYFKANVFDYFDRFEARYFCR